MYSTEEGVKFEMEIVELKAERAVMSLKVPFIIVYRRTEIVPTPEASSRYILYSQHESTIIFPIIN